MLLWASELGADVPSYSKLREVQAGLLTELGDPTRREQSRTGNVFYLNEIGQSIAMVSLYRQSRKYGLLIPHEGHVKPYHSQ